MDDPTFVAAYFEMSAYSVTYVVCWHNVYCNNWGDVNLNGKVRWLEDILRYYATLRR